MASTYCTSRRLRHCTTDRSSTKKPPEELCDLVRVRIRVMVRVRVRV